MSSECAASGPAIRVRDLGKCYHLYSRPQDRLKQALLRRWKCYYREFWALRHVNLEVQRGETVGIVGRNGSGKSTLLQMIAGTITPSEGSVEVRGRISALLELGSGFNPDFTGRENVFMNAAILGIPQAEMQERFDEVASFADIGEFIDQPVKIYSSGMYVRLAFAVATAVQPDVLIVDEALSVGDMLFQHKCIHRIRRMMEQGTTLVLVSHDPDTVRALCQRSLWLEHGRTRMLDAARVVSECYLASMRLERTADALKEQGLKCAEQPEPATDDAEPQPPALRPADPGSATWNSDAGTSAPDLEVPETAAPYGTDLVEIKQVRLLNESGDAVDHLQQQERFTIEVVLSARQDLDHVSVGVVIKDRLGIDLTGESVFNRSRRGFRIGPGRPVLVRFHAANNLRDGLYSVEVLVNRVSMWDRSDNVLLYSNPVALAFRVLRDPENPIWFRFQHDFKVEVS